MPSSWDTSTGLLEVFTLEVEAAWFGKNDKFPDNLLLNLRGPATVEGEVVDPEHTEIFTCGEAWKDGQGGAIAVSTAGAEMFNSNSKIGRLIDGIKALGKEAAFMSKRGESYEAESWVGITLDFERTKVGSFTTDEGELKEISAMIPVGIREGSDSAGDSAAETTSEDTPTPASSDGMGKAGLALLKALAKKSDDNDAFIAAALDPDQFKKAAELEADEELLDSVIDGSFYTEAN